MWRFASEVIFLLEEGEKFFFFLSVFYLTEIVAILKVTGNMVFTSMIHYTTAPRLHAQCLITRPLCSTGPKKAGTSTVELEVWGMGP
ncbi:hypothetical protein BYT27DRAFT_6735948 [Phlegmacium glaucopus]|nr:hypothetical protein BYT27DRAFT_6735948 [Phlegmacium glaucopus]